MREARAVVVAGGREEDLGLVLETPEGLAVHDAIAVALECRPDRVGRFGTKPALRAIAACRLRREEPVLARLEIFTNRH